MGRRQAPRRQTAALAGPEASGRRLVLFATPDGAYLAHAALRRYLHATVVSDVFLVPTDRGPGLEVPAGVVADRVMRALLTRFGGRVDPTVLRDAPTVAPPSAASDRSAQDR